MTTSPSPYFVFCIHNHQPVGNFEHVLEESFEASYMPFLEAMHRHPGVKLTLHNTGFLLDWVADKHPRYIDLLGEMVERGQAEIMGGGYYEPILAVIPHDDRVGQILTMSDRIEELFGSRPRGLWLAERVWEPTLPSILRECGVEYLVVDDYHFIKSGLRPDELGGYYMTEDQGNSVKVFPGSEQLRYLIPFKPAESFTEHMGGLGHFLKRGNAAIYGDDGEKFGVWPGTWKWVFEDGWMDSFLEKLEGAVEGGRVVSETMAGYMDRHDPLGTVYLSTTSYMEMGEWTLPPEASREYTDLHKELGKTEEGRRIEKYLQGGTWRNFFAKYPESNWMHKRMLRVSRELSRKAGRAAGKGDGGPGGEALAEARRHLFQAQCNDAYWHGVFGGLYMPHLRTKVYENLLEAERLLDGGRPGVTVETADVDADGLDEVVVSTGELNLFFRPGRGGTLQELDFLPGAVNLSNTLTRWPEGYHHRLSEGRHEVVSEEEEAKSIHDIVLVKEPGLERYLKYDDLQRASFRDHFLRPGETLEAFYAGEHTDLGGFRDGRYEHTVDGRVVRLARETRAGGFSAGVAKTVRAEGEKFTVAYEVAGGAGADFAVELNLLLPCCDGPVCHYTAAGLEGDGRGLGSTGIIEGLEEITLIDELTGVAVRVETTRPATLWRFPVHTVSLSEAGFEKIYQGSCLVLIYPLAKDPTETEISISCSSL